MISIYKNTKVYISIPAGARTAGPELMHQIAYYFRTYFKIETYIYAIPLNHKYPIPDDFISYNNTIANKIEDENQNILIVPEIYSTLLLLNGYKKIRKVIWWLSLDNYLTSKFVLKKHVIYLVIRAINKGLELFDTIPVFDMNNIAKLFMKKGNFVADPIVNQAELNLCSAKHVELFLTANGLRNVSCISEFLNEDFLKIETRTTEKENIIAFNPAKGINFTRKLIKSARHLNFVPIKNMSRYEVIKLLLRTKVYIDFGNHPGRDRLPREAAYLKCCIITNKKGGARLKEDMAIPEDYKFDDIVENIPAIINKIEKCLDNYQNTVMQFEEYRRNVRSETSKFLEDVGKVFLKVEDIKHMENNNIISL